MMEERPVTLVRAPRPWNQGKAAEAYEKSHPAAPRSDFKPEEGRLRVFAADPAPFFAAGFEEVLQRRMKGLPIVSPHLAVRVLPFKCTGCHWIGAVVTPWSVQAVFACGDRTHWKSLPAGVTVDLKLAGGDFTFLCVKDSILGQYLMCSLKSPVHDFADQAAADAFAKTCLDLMTTKAADEAEKPVKARQASQLSAPISRRGLFTRVVKEAS